jgi:hypothetical protein
VVQVVPSHASARVTIVPAASAKPTAVQAFVLRHETPVSSLSVPEPLGLLCIPHEDPLATSTSDVTTSSALVSEPTAVQTLAATHDTPCRSLPLVAPAGTGVDSTVHEAPLHRSASGTVCPEESVYEPTAVQASAAVHETADSSLLVALVGVGAGWICQDVPSQTSAKGTVTREALTS